MKKFIKTVAAIAAIISISHTALAQEEQTPAPAPKTPAYVSEKGYWIVESNVKTPKQYTIRFYNNDDTNVYTEKVEGVKLKLHKHKVKMNLKKVLESSIIAWETQKQLKENEGWVINALQEKK